MDAAGTPVPYGMTDIHVRQSTGQATRIFVNGELAAEVVCSKTDSQKDWEGELRRARALIAIPRMIEAIQRTWKRAGREDHVNTTPDKRLDAFAVGFVEGLAGGRPGHESINGLPSGGTIAFVCGHEFGSDIRRAALISQEPEHGC